MTFQDYKKTVVNDISIIKQKNSLTSSSTFGNESLEVDIISSMEKLVGLNLDRISMLVDRISTMFVDVLTSKMFDDVLMPKSANSSSLNIGGRSEGSSNQLDGETTDPAGNLKEKNKKNYYFDKN